MLTLAPTLQKFILHWGEKGTCWGVNRTVVRMGDKGAKRLGSASEKGA